MKKQRRMRPSQLDADQLLAVRGGYTSSKVTTDKAESNADQIK